MSERTKEHVDAFWNMIDALLNAVLFLLIGLELFALHVNRTTVLAGLLAIPVVLIARFLSGSLPVAIGRPPNRNVRGSYRF
jgi:monovalent cation:H+ antiporter, CPA1 family